MPAHSPWEGLRHTNCTRRSGSGYGSGRSMTALTTLKMAALAPMPSASVRSAAVVNAGVRTSVRQP